MISGRRGAAITRSLACGYRRPTAGYAVPEALKARAAEVLAPDNIYPRDCRATNSSFLP